MSNEEKILAMLEKHGEMLEKHGEMLEMMNARLNKVEADVQQAKEDAHWTRIKIESDIDKKVNLLLEGHTVLAETMAKKEQLDELREELGLQRYRIDLLAERRKA